MLRAFTSFRKFAFNRQCVRFVPQIRSFGEQPLSLFDKVLKYKTTHDELIELNLKEDHYTASILKALESAKVFGISPSGEETDKEKESLIQGITVSDIVFDGFSIQPSTIYLRNFYPALLKCLLDIRYSVLTGNPGISKSWFHWYILYQMVNKNVVHHDVEVPKLIVRQIARTELLFIFPHDCKAFRTTSVDLGHTILLRNFHHDAVLILVEPMYSKEEPIVYSGIKTILTCSPDQQRYKEFLKKGAGKVFMPVWSLDELKAVGAHIRHHSGQKLLDSDKIEERYHRFGGIFRHVIPVSSNAVVNAERLQAQVLGRTRPVDVFFKGTDIEKLDDQKDNISHMLLHYDVNYEEEDFMQFEMVFASEYVKKMIEQEDSNDEDLHTSVVQLNRMFRGGRNEDHFVFEHVVYQGLRRSDWKWEIYHEERQEWVNCKFEFKAGQLVDKEDEEILKNMQTNILYRPLNPQFSTIDMLWVELDEHGQKEFFGIQVTFAKEHSKSVLIYENLREDLGIKPEEKFNIYFITNPCHAETYARREQKSFISGASKSKLNEETLKFFTIKTEKFDFPLVTNW